MKFSFLIPFIFAGGIIVSHLSGSTFCVFVFTVALLIAALHAHFTLMEIDQLYDLKEKSETDTHDEAIHDSESD